MDYSVPKFQSKDIIDIKNDMKLRYNPTEYLKKKLKFILTMKYWI